MNDREYYYPESVTERFFNFLSALLTILVFLGLGVLTIALIVVGSILL